MTLVVVAVLGVVGLRVEDHLQPTSLAIGGTSSARGEALARNHFGLKLLQYARDEAHRFAQHYHHILRRKSQLEEDVKQGRRPPRKKPVRRAPSAQQGGEMPHTTS